MITAERAKDFHYRYFGRTIARIPLPLDALTRDLRDAYGVTPEEEQRLAVFLARRLGRAPNDFNSERSEESADAQRGRDSRRLR